MQKSTQIVCSNNVENNRKMPKTIKMPFLPTTLSNIVFDSMSD